MTSEPRYRFYGELAGWWPLISSPADYAEKATYAANLLRSAAGRDVREVLELGSGGGNNASYLKAHFAMTLVDLSDEMLEVSRLLNPECEHHRGDMRTIRLGREFDAVFVHDAVTYMVTETDLRKAMETAFVHCRPGGVAAFLPDETREIFESGTDHGGSDGEDGRAARYLEWTHPPDPTGTTFETDYVFVLRDADGSVRVTHETHRHGLFAREVWLRLMTEVGFAVERLTEDTTEDRTPRDVFVGRRP